MRGIYVYGWQVGYLPSATGIEAMHLRLLIALALLLGVPESSVAAPDSVSPDGSRSYTCGAERESAEGCFNTWTKLTHQGRSEGWVPRLLQRPARSVQPGTLLSRRSALVVVGWCRTHR